MTLYNMSQLSTGENIVEWLMIFNNFSEGVVFSGLAIGIVLLIFGVMKLQNVETDTAIMAASFIGFLITALLWLIEWDSSRLVPTMIPFLLLVLTSVAAFMKILRGWLE
jgi:hypothetical protein